MFQFVLCLFVRLRCEVSVEGSNFWSVVIFLCPTIQNNETTRVNHIRTKQEQINVVSVFGWFLMHLKWISTQRATLKLQKDLRVYCFDFTSKTMKPFPKTSKQTERFFRRSIVLRVIVFVSGITSLPGRQCHSFAQYFVQLNQ